MLTPAELTRRIAAKDSTPQGIRSDVESLLRQRGISGERPWTTLALSLVGTQNSDCLLALIAAEAIMQKRENTH